MAIFHEEVSRKIDGKVQKTPVCDLLIRQVIAKVLEKNDKALYAAIKLFDQLLTKHEDANTDTELMRNLERTEQVARLHEDSQSRADFTSLMKIYRRKTR